MEVRFMKIAVLCLLTSFAIFSCSDDPGTDDVIITNELQKIDLSRSESQVVSASEGFAFDFLAESVKANRGENVVVSPFSMSCAWAMAANGAIGSTREEIIKVLGFEGLDVADVNSYYNKMFAAFPELDNSTNIQIANGFFTQSRSVLQEFLDVLQNDYTADLVSVYNKEDLPSTINDWVSEKTNGMITQFWPDYDYFVDAKGEDNVIFNPYYILNAFYFDGKWTDKFDKSKTKKDKFYNCDGSIASETQFMNMEAHKVVYYDDNSHMVKLYFGNYAYAVEFILPNEGVDIDEYISSIDSEKHNQLCKNYKTVNLKLSLPKFDIATDESKRANIEDILRACGFSLALSTDGDYSGICDGATIEYVRQKCSFMIDEEGGVAVAVTQLTGMDIAYNDSSVPDDMELKFNRPFIYVLTENTTGTILMTGVINKL